MIYDYKVMIQNFIIIGDACDENLCHNFVGE